MSFRRLPHLARTRTPRAALTAAVLAAGLASPTCASASAPDAAPAPPATASDSPTSPTATAPATPTPPPAPWTPFWVEFFHFDWWVTYPSTVNGLDVAILTSRRWPDDHPHYPDVNGIALSAIGSETYGQINGAAVGGFNISHCGINGLSAGILTAAEDDLNGLHAALFVVATDQGLNGVSAGIVGVTTKGELNGLQTGLIATTRHGDVNGAIIAAVTGSEGNTELNGVSVGLLINGMGLRATSRTVAEGGPFIKSESSSSREAFLSDRAQNNNGLQLSAVVNQCNKLRGVQFGLLNFAGDDDGGVQIGLLNFSSEGTPPFFPLVRF